MVDAGQWLLYRHHPDRTAKGENALQIDTRRITNPVGDFLRSENRFNQLLKGDEARAKQIIDATQHDIDLRWQMYQHLATRKPLTPAAAPGAAPGVSAAPPAAAPTAAPAEPAS